MNAHVPSCRAFSTVGAVEGAWQLAGRNLTSLSEQQLVDCSVNNGGCETVVHAFTRITRCFAQRRRWLAAASAQRHGACSIQRTVRYRRSEFILSCLSYV